MGLPIEVFLRHSKDTVVIGQKAGGSVNDFHRCPECRMGSSYPVPLYDGTPIQCPHCGWTRPHNCLGF
jgi:uncharacterized paraquat-inducible protein A